MKRLMLCVGLLAVCGCQAAGPKSLDDLMKVVQEVEKIAERQGTAWSVDAEWTGDASAGEQVRFYLDTGLAVKVHVQGNAAANREAIP